MNNKQEQFKPYTEEFGQKLQKKILKVFIDCEKDFDESLIALLMLRTSIGILFTIIKDQEELVKLINLCISSGIELSNDLKKIKEQNE